MSLVPRILNASKKIVRQQCWHICVLADHFNGFQMKCFILKTEMTQIMREEKVNN